MSRAGQAVCHVSLRRARVLARFADLHEASACAASVRRFSNLAAMAMAMALAMRGRRTVTTSKLVCAIRNVRVRPSSSAGSGESEAQDVGFIGLGNMGGRMANNLLKSGHRLTVHDRNAAAAEALANRGASVGRSPREVAEASDVVITMLPSSPHVEEVYLGRHGLLAGVGGVRPSLLIDASTVDPHTCRMLAAKVAKCTLGTNSKNIGAAGVPVLLDAPVSGGVVGAEAATLTFMVGGCKEGLRAADPLLRAMGSGVVYCGGTGNGAAAKVCNNLALAISMAGVAEALALGQRLGIDAHTLSSIFNSSSARCWSSDTYNPVPGVMANVPASHDYKGGFSSQLLAKDLGLALAAAKEAEAAVPLGGKVLEMYDILCKAGHSSLDFSSIFQCHYKGNPERNPLD